MWTQLANACFDAEQSTTTSSQRRAIQQINNSIKEKGRTTPNVIAADPTAYLIDNSHANGNQGGMIGGQTGAVTGYALGGLHPAQRGTFGTGYVIAQGLAPYLRRLWINHSSVRCL